MRVVREPGELEDAFAAARREAQAAFGDDRVFCERYVERPRHVEIQLLADARGDGRRARRARVLGPAPPPESARGVALPALDAELRTRMSEAAVAFAAAVGYRSAGTAEFMLDGRDFWFLELNGRIQVEHPVTELVTGVDLVQSSSSASRRASRSTRRSGISRATLSRCGCMPRTRRRSCPRAAGSNAAAPDRDPRRRGHRGGRRGRYLATTRCSRS